MTQLEMWGLNIYFLIGALLLLGAGSVLLVVLATGVKVLIWRIQQRRAMRAYRSQTRRSDGWTYPPRRA